MKKIILLGLFSVSFLSTLMAQVPSEWSTAKVQLILKLKQINTEVVNRWDNQSYCTNFAGNLMLAPRSRPGSVG